jgi:hypothetical protein
VNSVGRFSVGEEFGASGFPGGLLVELINTSYQRA